MLLERSKGAREVIDPQRRVPRLREASQKGEATRCRVTEGGRGEDVEGTIKAKGHSDG